jgi:hypothetical protein
MPHNNSSRRRFTAPLTAIVMAQVSMSGQIEPI